MSWSRRATASIAVVALLGASLTGCSIIGGFFGVTGSYEDTVEWLEDQPILTSVVKITAYEKEYETHGEVRGELDPAATPAEIEAFALEAVAFLDGQDRSDIDVYLGHGDINFAIDDAATTTRAIPLWQQVEQLPDIRGALVHLDSVTTRSLKSDIRSVVGSLRALGVSFRAEGLNDDAAFETDVPPGAYSGQIDERFVATLLFERECAPDPDALELALDVTAEGAGGILTLCRGWELNYPGPIGATAIELRARLDAAGLTGGFRVTMSEVRRQEYDVRERTVSVTPGLAEALEIVRDVDASSVLPDDGSFTLDENGDFRMAAYDLPTSQLAAVLLTSRATSFLNAVDLAGQNYAVKGVPDDLRNLAGGAESLDDAAQAFDYFTLQADALDLGFPNDGGNRVEETDVRTAAGGLFDSGLWEDRQISVNWNGADLFIDSGVALELEGKASYSEPLEWFRDEWTSLQS